MESHSSQTSRLILGTAQLGMPYGVANRIGQPDVLAAESIVATAWQGGIREFDTAQAYGESERVLGSALNSLGIAADAKVISKLHPEIDHRDSGSLQLALEESLTRLGIPKLFGMMLHSEDLLDLWDKGLGEVLQKFVDKGLVEQIGVSVYSPQKAVRALKIDGIAMVQIPGNLLDRRFEKKGVFQEAGRYGKQIYLRSVFLQGLLLMNVGDLPNSLRFAIPVLENLADFSRRTSLTLKQLALGFVRTAYPTQKVIFGCETAQQVKENLELWAEELPAQLIASVQREFHNIPVGILNPSLWAQTSEA